MADLDINIDDIDLDSVELDDLDLSDFGEVNDSIEFPHIKVSSKLFKEFLKVSKKICSSGGKDIISKSTCIKFDSDKAKVIAYATDFDVYVEQEFECLNTENVLTDAVIVPTDILIKLTTAVPSSTCFYKKDDVVYIRLYGGDMELETNTMAIDKFKSQDVVEHDSTITTSDLKDVLKDFSPVAR